MLDQPLNAHQANAPVNFPAIWDAPQHHHVQWNGSVDNTATFGPLGRNSGQVIGVFGLVKPEGTLLGYDSSINFESIKRAEELITKLWSPAWPSEFGVDQSKVERGKTVYHANCLSCHAIINRKDPNRKAKDVLIPIDEAFGPYPKLGTDPTTAKNWRERKARPGVLAGKTITAPFSGKFPSNPAERVPARKILTHLVFNSIARSFYPWREELTIDDANGRSIMLSRVRTTETLMRYKSRPLNGVWSTSPYLHNGSVLNMEELLTKPIDRLEQFKIGTTEYDPSTLGFKNDGPFNFDATKDGNRNLGHAYGVELSEDDKKALIEYLKTL